MEGKRISIPWTTVALALIIALVVPWAVWADVPAPDGDGAVPIPFNGNPLELGNVCANSTITDTALIAIRRQGGNNVAFANGSTVTISVAAVMGTGLTANIGTPNTIGLPGNWVAQPSNTVSTGYVTSNVQLVAGSAGSFAGTITYRASGTNANGDSITRDTDMAVTATIINCAPPDTTPPVISYSVSGTKGNDDWYVTDVTVDWTVSDPESAVTIDSGCVDTTIDYDTTGVTLSCVAHSAGGSSSASVTIKRDATPPSISASLDKSPAASGWFNSSTGAPTVSFNCSDATSGIASCPAAYTFGEGENQSRSGTAYDNAGNSASAGVSDIDVDLTAPTFVACPAGGPFLLGSGPQSVGPISASDALSGLNASASTLSGVVDTSTIGTKYVTFTAVDNAGNSATKTCDYKVIYNWTGFFRPVDNPPILNVAKAGSAIPVKFSLAGNQGLGIFAAGYPKVWVIACDASAPQEPVEETVTAGQSSLSYDPLVDQYIYVWKTNKAWAGTCRQLEVKLIDGTSHFANFSFK